MAPSAAKKYPLLVMSNHPRWGVHSQHDDITWFREIDTCKVKGPDGYQYQPLWMQPGGRGSPGHQVWRRASRIFNERGTVLAGAYVTERIMPGAVGIDHGAKYDPIVPGEYRPGRGHQHHRAAQHHLEERGGHAVQRLPGRGEKADLEGLGRKYPDAFARECHITRRSVLGRLH